MDIGKMKAIVESMEMEELHPGSNNRRLLELVTKGFRELAGITDAVVPISARTNSTNNLHFDAIREENSAAAREIDSVEREAKRNAKVYPTDPERELNAGNVKPNALNTNQNLNQNLNANQNVNPARFEGENVSNPRPSLETESNQKEINEAEDGESIESEQVSHKKPKR